MDARMPQKQAGARRRRSWPTGVTAAAVAVISAPLLSVMVCSFTDAFNPPHPVAKTLRLQKSSPSTLALYAMEDSGDDAVAAKHTSPKGFSGFATTSIRQRRRQGRKRSIKGERRVKKGGDWQRRRRFNQSSGRGIQQRYLWLRRASTNLLDPAYPKGSLTNGKWHELSSMMLSWSTLLKDVEFEQLLRLASRSSSDVRNIPAIMIEGLLKRILDEKEAGNTGVEVNVDMYEMAIEAWAIVSSATEDQKVALAAANRADDILRSLQDKCVHTGDENLKPTSQSFLTCLGAFANAACPKPTPEASDRSAAAAKCDETLQWMEDLAFEGRNIDAAPSTMAYSLAMDAYAKSGDRDAGAKAEVILRRLISSPAQENTRCYNIVINAFIQGRRGGAIDNAERILAEMEQKYAATSNASIRPDVVSYTSVINGWANARRKSYGAQRAENILNRMQAISDGTTVVANQAVDGIVIAAPVRPNVITYNAVLKAWSRSQDNRAPAKAEAIVRTMESMYKAGNNDAKFDRTTFNTLIHTLSNGGKVETAQRAEDILQRTEILADRGHLEWAPNLYTYNSCIEAWAKVTDPAANSAEHAYRILLRLIAQYEHGDNVRPNSFSYNQVIFALAKSSVSDAAVRSEYVLRLMEKAQAEGNSDVQADVFSYSSVISAWSSSGKQGAGRRAEQLLEKMQRLYERGETRLKPNTVTMNSVIDCWAKSGRGTLGARRAESILNRMEKQYKSGDATLKPNALTYNSVLSAWAKSGTKCAHWKAEVLVNKMWDLHKSGNHSNVKPDVFTFNTLIDAISKSQREGKAEKSLRILRRMDKLYQSGYKYARPNETTYTSVLNSCAFTSAENDLAKRKALDVAIFTLEELQESHYGKPNHITYGMFLKACANLMKSDDERWRNVVEPIILQCCKDGFVGDLVLNQLRTAAPSYLYTGLLNKALDESKSQPNTKMTKIQDLPAAWSKNVRERSGRTRYRGTNRRWKRP